MSMTNAPAVANGANAVSTHVIETVDLRERARTLIRDWVREASEKVGEERAAEDALRNEARIEMAAWLQALKSDTTRRGYSGDWQRFADWLDIPEPQIALAAMITRHRGDIVQLIELYRDDLNAAAKSPSSVNRALAAISGPFRRLDRYGKGPGILRVEGMAAAAFRDTKGPGVAGAQKLFQAAQQPRRYDPDGHGARRDTAIMRLLFDHALRRNEVATLRLVDVNIDARQMLVLRKGKRERIAIEMTPASVTAMAAWLAVRADYALPDTDNVFVSLARNSTGQGMTGNSIYAVVTRLAKSAGIVARPHGLRHASVTAVLESTSDLVTAQRHAGHASPAVTARYDDRGDSAARRAQRAISELVGVTS